jgi:hypothetical protein
MHAMLLVGENYVISSSCSAPNLLLQKTQWAGDEAESHHHCCFVAFYLLQDHRGAVSGIADVPTLESRFLYKK